MGISGSGPPPLYAHYNLLLPTVPYDIPPARPLRFSIGIEIILFTVQLRYVLEERYRCNIYTSLRKLW